MKKNLFLGILIFASFSTYAQVLLEDKDGDVIVRNQFKKDDNISLIKLNTGDESLGFDYITSTKSKNENDYLINEFGVKAKPTEGYATVFSNNQLSPGVKFSYAITKVRIFSKKITDPFIDWAGIEFNYDLNQYSLFNRNNAFKDQFFEKNFNAVNAYINYNYLVTTGGSSINSKLLFTVKAGYSKRNNYDDLNSVTVEDVNSIIDPVTSTQRQITTTKTLKEGSFEEFNVYPLIFAVTKLTPTDSPASPDTKKLRIGYTAYFKNLASVALPKQDLGLIFFLTKQDKSGIRNPVFGLDIQADDPFNIYNTNNSFQSRITLGFTTIFSL